MRFVLDRARVKANMKIAIALATLMSAACATGQVGLTAAGAEIVTSPNPPSLTCQNLGTLVGSHHGGVSDGAEYHVQGALNDARNQAASMGANYAQLTTPQLIPGRFGTYGAIVTATAFRCPE
jgi:hypothetical protein